MTKKVSAQDMPRSQTHAESARVEQGYECLDVIDLKKAFDELNAVLDRLATTVVQSLDEMVPYWAKMQSLLSQRGADRKKVLQRAGLPGWTHWAKAYASKLDRSLRTIQDRIRQFRGQQTGGTGKTKSGSNGERVRLDGRQQAALVKAQLAANELVAALKNGADWQAPLAEYEKVAVTPARLDNFMNALSPEPDWKNILTRLVDTLEHCGGELPVTAMNALRAVQKLLDGKPGQQQSPSGKGKSVVAKQNRVQRHRKDAGTCCAVRTEEVSSEDARKLPAPVNTTASLPDRGPEEEHEQETLDAARVQGSSPVAAERESTPSDKRSPEYRLRKTKVQREYSARKKATMVEVQAAAPAAAEQPSGAAAVPRSDLPGGKGPTVSPVERRPVLGKPPAPVKITVCPPALSPEEEEREHETLDAASGHPGRRLGNFVRDEKGKYGYEPELGMSEAEEIRNAQPGEQQLPPGKPIATATKLFRAKKRTTGDTTDFVVRDGDNLPDEVFDSKGEAVSHCERLNAPPVAGIVPQEGNPRSASQSAA